ncbi:MAG: RNA polymerase factor sigma-54 [Desulfurivibrionaceae bacterium]|nr:RNA polymerase factor sigma-54 [Desulfobulbales bacterium]MDT8334222.1 RNA polymerase factor sigma-54 [Desulfurivibrionaceae bacterium]
MVLELRQQLKLSQQLVMTPQLQQAIKLLQLSRLELVDAIQQEIEQNPVLEELPGGDEPEESDSRKLDSDREDTGPVSESSERTAEVQMESTSSLQEINWQDYANEYEPLPSFKPSNDPDLPSRLDILSKKPNLQSHLHWQLSLSPLNDEEKAVGEYIIGNLDRDGFLRVDSEAIAEATGVNVEKAEEMVFAIQAMDPPGIGARSVRESLLLQLNHLELGRSLAARIVRDHLPLMEKRNYGGIAKATGCSPDEVRAALKIIMNLDPFPGRQYSDEEPHYILPDVFVYKIDDEYVIMMNDEGLPRLQISSFYREILKDERAAPAGTKNYIQEKMKSAAWLIKSIQQRQRTIYRVMESIIKFQRDFFDKGVEYLKPLVLRDVAEDIEMHESTISRVTSSKYVHTPQGIFELKYFFNSAIERRDGGDALSSMSIKNKLQSIIRAEDTGKPLSDNALAEIFKKDGIKLARRTVAKYREQLGILPSKLRKSTKF